MRSGEAITAAMNGPSTGRVTRLAMPSVLTALPTPIGTPISQPFQDDPDAPPLLTDQEVLRQSFACLQVVLQATGHD